MIDKLVSIVTPAGEFVGRLEYQGENKVILKNPKKQLVGLLSNGDDI